MSTAAATSTATSGNDPLDAMFQDDIPTTDFPIEVVNQLGETTTRAKPTDQVAVTDGEVAAPAKPAVVEKEPIAEVGKPAEEPVEDEAEVGEPYQIGKDGRVRGPDGRFTDKPKDIAAAEAKAAADASGVDAAKPVAFKYRTMGETKDLEGATLDAKGNLTVPAEHVSLIRAAFNALHVRDVEIIPTMQKTQAENATLKQRISQLETGSTAKEAQAQAVLDRFDRVMQEPDDEKFVEEMFKLRTSLPQLTLQAERDHYRRLAESGRAVAPATAKTPEPPAAVTSQTPGLPSREDALAAATDFVATLKIEHAFQDVSEKDWQQFESRVARTPLAYVRPATEADAKAFDVEIGEAVFDRDLMREDIDAHVGSIREQRAAALTREKLIEDNSRSTIPHVATPPAVSAAKAPAPKKSSGFTSKDEVDRWLDSNEL